MSFLKKLGVIIVKGLGIASGLLPLVAQAVPGSAGTVQVISQDLVQMMQIIITIEAAGESLGLPGPDKLRMAAPQIVQILVQSAGLVGKPIHDPALLLRAGTKIADGLADALNAVHESAAVETPLPAAPSA